MSAADTPVAIQPGGLWLAFTQNRLAWVGLVLLALIVLVALLAPWLAPHDPLEQNIVARLEPPSAEFWLGTDSYGRDVLSRLIYGARNSITLALLTTALSFVTGTTLGLVAAVRGGLVDQALGRLVDLVMAFPTLIFALLVLAVAGSMLPVLIGVIALLDATRVFRIARAAAMDVAAQDFVEVARLRGEGTGWIMRREILPNIVVPLAAEFGLRFCFVFLFIATLSFIGLGIQPPTADWGSMVRENAAAISFGILMPLFPAGAIALLTIGINLVIDWAAAGNHGVSDER